ncbi:sulfide/dihydroorotate dehydrogenase-like FAD/NAD-binding protein [Clostridium ihumii]|uniref:sulfide/dihydroorotate dehydrogenase-like FAD/NAD-binding protein n=1 Tax=Clostridium ihumii TaxID=1470356 RepID=UPI00054EEC6D|nr:sulfide/dihydroorotate dehydrogenase-like FAD/NAD-binding protein [Clostridium ihumii]
MYKITEKRDLAPNIFLMNIEAPRVAKSAKPGQFIILRNTEDGERVPLTVCDTDPVKGTVTIVVQAMGCSTKELATFNEGDYVHDFVGPLGVESELLHEDIEELKNKKILFIAGGVGAAPVYPQVKWLHEHGVKADVIMGFKNKEMVILEEEMKSVSGNVFTCTDDGSYAFKGMVTAQLEELYNQGQKYDLCICIGPMIMMKFACRLTEKLNLQTVVSMNPIMVDGTGMCGACRITVDGETKFACVDGPEFDGHKVDFDQAMRRSGMYKAEEAQKSCRLGGTK